MGHPQQDADTAARPYHGVDRRSSVTFPVSGVMLGRGACLGAALLLAVAVVILAYRPLRLNLLLGVGAVMWLTATVNAALSLLFSWRVCGRSRDVWIAGTLLVSAVGSPVAAGVLEGGGQAAAHSGAWLVGPCLMLVAAAYCARTGEVDEVISDLSIAVFIGKLGLRVLGAACFGLVLGMLLPAPPSAVPLVLTIVGPLAVGFVALASPGIRRDVRFVLACAFTLVSVSRMLLGDVTQQEFGFATLASIGFLGAACGVVMAFGVDRFRVAQVHDQRRGLRLLARVTQSSLSHDAEAARRHDARSALAAVQMANELLLTRSEGLDPSTRTELVDGVRTELRRVAALLRAPAPTATASVEQRLESELSVLRCEGIAMESQIESMPDLDAPPSMLLYVASVIRAASDAVSGRCLELRARADHDVLVVEIDEARAPIRAQLAHRRVSLADTQAVREVALDDDALVARIESSPGRGLRLRLRHTGAYAPGSPSVDRAMQSA
ncbi:MAG: hypothetical protein ACRDP1_13925 [Nocardioidaceae bacterium]